jgi:hypothetical protein
MLMKNRLHLALLLFASMAFVSPARSWWDTRIKLQRPAPLVREYSAAALPGVPAEAIRRDAQANGGQGGEVVALAPQSDVKLQVQADLPRSIYAVFAIARTEAAFDKNKRPPAFFTLAVTQPDGTKKSWTMPVTYLNTYEAVAQIYFPAYAAGHYAMAVSLDSKSEIPFLVDRLELRDALAGTARQAAKTRRMLIDDEELRKIRAAAGKKEPRYNAATYGRFNPPVVWPADKALAPRTLAERRATAEKIWAALPDFNADTRDGEASDPYNWLIGHDRPGLVVDGARIYQEYDDPEVAWDAAVMLAALAERYPALDTRVQGTTTQFRLAPDPFGFTQGPGKFVYSGWAAFKWAELVTAYDQLFDAIKDNQELAGFLGTKIPWIKTPHDVIELIDTNLLQHGMDAYHRRQLQGNDRAMALAPLVQGVNEVSRRMLEDNLWSRVDLNIADAGSLDDQIFTAYSRDGVRYIGSSGYIGNELIEIAELLHRYVQDGGDPKYDLLDAARYPHLARAQYAIDATNVAGGFPLIIGDSRDLHVGRLNAAAPAYPSRVLGGFGVAILEDGQKETSAAMKRAVAVRTGLGVGHAQQDTLNLDITALGCRLAPDLGGREEGQNRGRPNMRWNRVHNLVEVDEKNFENIVPGSTTGATGWTRLFSPVPGSQAMINAARATSHPNVSLYERTTAMIDGPQESGLAPIYVFDVFRVAGGKTHTYAFHGAESDDFQINTPLAPATSADAIRYLDKYKEGTKREGWAPGVLEATWRLRADMEKSWLDASDEKARRATKLTLFGQQGDGVFVGNAYSDHYHYDFPFLSVQKRGADGLQSTFVSLVETYAGQPFIASQRALKIAGNETDARAAAAVEVLLKNERCDILFADGRPEKVRSVEGGLTAAGAFAFYSEDGQGLRQMHLAGGTLLKKGDAGIAIERAEYSAPVASVDYGRRSLQVRDAIAPAALNGEVALLGNPRHVAEFNLAGGKALKTGAEIQTVETPQFYQSEITQIDPKTGSVVCELEPTIMRSDPLFYEGATASNEAGDKFWKVHVVADERWMHVGWPGYRTSVPNTIRMSEIPDANGDGKHTLRMLAAGKAGDQGGAELVMDVMHVDEKENTFYFKMPDDPGYQSGGWQFQDRKLVNEDGSKVWRGMYAGTSYRFVLTGPPVNEAAFPDADKDGKRKLKIYQFGPGDRFTLPTCVAVTRLSQNGVATEYEVRANTPCTLTLPGRGRIEWKDASGWRNLKTKVSGRGTAVEVSAALLNGAPIRLRLLRD